MPLALCKTTPSASLPSPSQLHNHHLSLPSSLPFSMNLNKKTNFRLSCSSHSFHFSDSINHSSGLRLSQVCCSSNSASDLTPMDESEGLKYIQVMEEYEDWKVVFVMSSYTDFGIKFCDSIDEMSKLPEPNLNKLPVELVNSMKQRMGEVQVEAEKNNWEECPRLLGLGFYRKMLLCGFDDHHNQQQKKKTVMKNSNKDDQKRHLSQKYSFMRGLIRTRLMQLFQRIGLNELEGGVMEIPGVMADAYLFGAFCSLCSDQMSSLVDK